MENRFFGFDSSQMNLSLPNEQQLEMEMKDIFGHKSFETSLIFSQAIEHQSA